MTKKTDKALGMLEFSKIPIGMYNLDQITKGNNIEILYSATVCPGKYIALFQGDISSVNQSVEFVKKNSESLIDSFVLGNPSEGLIDGILGKKGSLLDEDTFGVIEGYSVAAVTECADIILKSVPVKLFTLKLANMMCGKSYFIVGGKNSEIYYGVEIGKQFLEEKDMLVDSSIISNPNKEYLDKILR